MRLDGGLGNTEFIGDLLVEKSLGKHAENPALLRRQCLQTPYQLSNLGILFGPEFKPAGRPDLSSQDSFDTIANFIDAVFRG